MRDIVLVSIPYIEYTLPPAAPAVIKGSLKLHGFDAYAFDLNIEFRNRWKNLDSLEQIKEYWNSKKDNLGNLRLRYDNIVKNMAKELVELNTQWIGISVFSRVSQQFCIDLVNALNQLPRRGKIVIGGNGVDAVFAHTLESKIDAWIQGEGEIALVELLRGNMEAPGIMKPNVQLEDLNNIGIADYSDYNLNAGYDNFYDSPAIQINGSRGCVRNCSFCNVNSIWPRFRYKSGKLIAEEIIKIYEDTKIKHFFFTDSLINGNLKELMIFMNQLAEYKEKNNAAITWGGQWIVRKQRGLPKNYYDLIKRSGGLNITIGVETGSDRVREHMKKGYSTQDLDEEIEQFSLHGIRCGFLMMVGYPTETEEDFQDTLNLFCRYTKYVADGTIIGVTMGHGFLIEEESPIVAEQLNKTISILDNNRFRWYSLTTNTSFIESIRRRLIAGLVLDKLGWPDTNPEKDFLSLTVRLQNMQTNGNSVPSIIEVNKDLSVDPKFFIDYSPQPYHLELAIEGFNDPNIEISINQQIVYRGVINGLQQINCAVDNINRRQVMRIKILNFVDIQRIELKELKISDVRIRKDIIWLHGKVSENNKSAYNSNSLYTNGVWRMYFENSPLQYFIKQHNFYYSKHGNLKEKYIQKVLEFYNNL